MKKAICLLMLLCFGLSAHAKNHSFRNVWHPTYLGARLDYCSLDHKHCGKALANRFCRQLGYDRASQAIIAHNVGLTHYIDTRVQCKGWRCNGFMTIGCVRLMSHSPPKTYHYRQRAYYSPRFEHYLVDWCYHQGRGCGFRAANAFCSHMGYLKASRIVKQRYANATRSIGSQELCFGKHCNAFKHIVCYR